jgi:multiple sugar transport system substrate-binding protein
VTALVLAAAMACMGPGGAGQDGDLVWAIDATAARSGGPAADVVSMWNQLHPNGPSVRIETLPQAADDQRQQMVLELNSGGGEFDILSVDVVWIGEFAGNGWLADLEDLRPQIEQVSLPGPLQSAIWNGRLWAAPYTTDAGLLYYRTDLVDHPPSTWQELMDVGLRVGKEHGIAPFVGQGMQYEGLVVNYLEYFWGAGGELFTPDGANVLFQEEPALQAIEFMKAALRNSFYAPGFNTMKEEDARNAFQSGRAVFMRNWPDAYELMSGQDPRNPSAVAGKFAIAPLPTFTGEETVTGLGGHNLGVSRFSDHAEAAKEFVRFASTTPDVQRSLAQRYSEAPTMASVYRDLGGDPVMALLGRVLPSAKPRPPTPQWAAVSEVIQREVFAAYNGERDPRAAVAAIRAVLESTIAKG